MRRARRTWSTWRQERDASRRARRRVDPHERRRSRCVASGGAKKGDVIGIARIAAIQAAKRTAELIPLCHPLPLTRVAVEFELDAATASVRCEAQVETFGRTGVEMEALTAVQVGLLTIYDMCKAVDRGMVIDGVRVLEKRGGKSGDVGRRGVAADTARQRAKHIYRGLSISCPTRAARWHRFDREVAGGRRGSRARGMHRRRAAS